MPKSIADEALALISARREKRESPAPTNLASSLVSHDSEDSTSDKAQDKERGAHDDADLVIDTVEAARHLRLYGIGAMDPVILCAYGNTNKFVPAHA